MLLLKSQPQELSTTKPSEDGAQTKLSSEKAFFGKKLSSEKNFLRKKTFFGDARHTNLNLYQWGMYLGRRLASKAQRSLSSDFHIINVCFTFRTYLLRDVHFGGWIGARCHRGIAFAPSPLHSDVDTKSLTSRRIPTFS